MSSVSSCLWTWLHEKLNFCFGLASPDVIILIHVFFLVIIHRFWIARTAKERFLHDGISQHNLMYVDTHTHTHMCACTPSPAMNRGGVKVHLHLFLTSELGAHYFSTSYAGPIMPKETTCSTHWMGGGQAPWLSWTHLEETLSPQSGIRTCIMQPADGHFWLFYSRHQTVMGGHQNGSSPNRACSCGLH